MGGFLGLLVAHLADGVAGYRRAMRGPWPAVRPLVTAASFAVTNALATVRGR